MAIMDRNDVLCGIINDFEQFTCKPETFITVREHLPEEIKRFLKSTYDITKTQEDKLPKSNSLPELIIQNFDDEQIFQQIELQNEDILNAFVSKVSRLAVAKDRLIFNELDDDVDDEQSTASKSDVDDNDDIDNHDEKSSEGSMEEDKSEIEDSDVENDEEGSEHSNNSRKHKGKPSVLDDNFFKLNEMNDFLISQEKEGLPKKKIAKSDSESEDDDIDMFEASEGEDEENDQEGNDKLRNPRYKDFFGKRKQTEDINDIVNNIDDKEYMEAVKSNLHSRKEHSKTQIDDTEATMSSEKPEPKSNLELREERLKRKIDEIEGAAVSEKAWQLKGEVTGENRPLNSLLQEVLEFDLTTRPAPVITEETTQVLEDVIKQRIKDKVFDDVERKQKPVDTPLEFKKKLVLDQEKSKESLAQIYEKEFIKQREALNTDHAEKEEVEPQLHQEIKTMMHKLFSKFDALSNFHFTPKPIAPELKIVNNLPAISMEEVAPVASTDATLLAPEEVKPKVNAEIGKSERTKTDKKRERRKKKQKQREHALVKTRKENAVNKLRPGLGNKYTKEKAKKMLEIVTKDANVDKMNHSFGKKIKSSTAFFSQLQDNVTSQIKLQKQSKGGNKIKPQRDVKRLKL